MIIAGAATALSVPSPASSFSFNDYPSWAVAKGVSAASVIHVVVNPDGKVAQCTNVRELGDLRLAKAICPILGRRRLESPTLRNGQKVHAILETMIQLFLPDTEEGRKMMALQSIPDAELSVNKLPNGTTTDVSVLLAYDLAGRVTDCSPSEQEKELALANVACSQRTLFDHAIQNDLTGKPVAYVTRKRVRFSVAQPAK